MELFFTVPSTKGFRQLPPPLNPPSQGLTGTTTIELPFGGLPVVLTHPNTPHGSQYGTRIQMTLKPLKTQVMKSAPAWVDDKDVHDCPTCGLVGKGGRERGRKLCPNFFFLIMPSTPI